MQIKRAGWIREGHYDVEMKEWLHTGDKMMCKLRGWVDG